MPNKQINLTLLCQKADFKAVNNFLDSAFFIPPSRDKRITKKETYLYFGMHDGRRLTSEDYMGVMRGLGFSECRAEGLYQELMEVSRNLSKQRGEERSILIGGNSSDDE